MNKLLRHWVAWQLAQLQLGPRKASIEWIFIGTFQDKRPHWGPFRAEDALPVPAILWETQESCQPDKPQASRDESKVLVALALPLWFNPPIRGDSLWMLCLELVSSCISVPGPRTVATLEPPQGYWESFHQEWLQRVGGCYFAVGRQSLQFVKNEDDWLYCCLLVEPELSLFPVIRPHMSLCRCRFDTFQAFWAAKICCQSRSRNVRGDFTQYGKGINFWICCPGHGQILFELEWLPWAEWEGLFWIQQWLGWISPSFFNSITGLDSRCQNHLFHPTLSRVFQWLDWSGSTLEISRMNFTIWALLQLNTKCLDAFVTMFSIFVALQFLGLQGAQKWRVLVSLLEDNHHQSFRKWKLNTFLNRFHGRIGQAIPSKRNTTPESYC